MRNKGSTFGLGSKILLGVLALAVIAAFGAASPAASTDKSDDSRSSNMSFLDPFELTKVTLAAQNAPTGGSAVTYAAQSAPTGGSAGDYKASLLEARRARWLKYLRWRQAYRRRLRALYRRKFRSPCRPAWPQP
jgi:hypothetical protein